MSQTADNDDRVVIASASNKDAECPLCGSVVDADTWKVALNTDAYDADVTHLCPTENCEGAASMSY